ncbi:MAG: 4Fe-4S dicluster domain-containing protein [Bacteroidales bacterium]
MAWLAEYPREKVQWYPTVDLSKCTQCGMCMNCGKQVFTWTSKGPVVTNPYACTIGCTTCANLCEGNAITFPSKAALREQYEKERLWAKVTKQMKKDGYLTFKEI